MIYEDVVRNFAERTRANLRAVEQLRSAGNEVYEVTQLVNSTLGLLIFPQQKYVDKIAETPIEQLAQCGWPIPKVRDGFQQVQNLRQLIRYLRNAIAHFNIGDGQNDIQVLRVWNTWKGQRTWEADLSVQDLRQITDRFIEQLLDRSEIK